MALELNSVVADFDRLPGELRNEIYTLVFTSKDPIQLSLNSNEPFSLRARDPHVNQVLHSLEHLCSINDQIRQGARSFFFNENVFDCEVCAEETQIPAFDYVDLYNQFLTWVGRDGCPRLRSLKLRVAAGNRWGPPNWNNLKVFLPLISECSSLHTLYLYLDMDYIAAESSESLRTFLLDNGRLLSMALKAFAEQLTRHLELKCFRIYCLLTPKWSFNVAAVARFRKNHPTFSILDQQYQPKRQANNFVNQLRAELMRKFRMVEVRLNIL